MIDVINILLVWRSKVRKVKWVFCAVCWMQMVFSIKVWLCRCILSIRNLPAYIATHPNVWIESKHISIYDINNLNTYTSLLGMHPSLSFVRSRARLFAYFAPFGRNLIIIRSSAAAATTATAAGESAPNHRIHRWPRNRKSIQLLNIDTDARAKWFTCVSAVAPHAFSSTKLIAYARACPFDVCTCARLSVWAVPVNNPTLVGT